MEISIDKLIFCYVTVYMCMLTKIKSNENNCTSEQFVCHEVINQCVPLNWICDGNADCFDGSDEIECNTSCRPDEFTCSNNNCIQKNWICDHDDDCGDNSDESKCMNICHDNGSVCVTRNCSTGTWICDGDYDCFDSSDELNCSQNQVENIYCSINEFYCKDKITCIHPSWICDGEDDCLNGEDESLDKCQHSDCKKNEFECQNKTCIPDKLVCNGNIDCMNGEDERACSHVTVDCSSLNKFKCSEGSCVHWNHTCDKYPHCIGWEDEDERLCKINECLENNGNCMQECIDLPIGYKCLCRKGFEMIQKTRCIDINECLEPDSCSQVCKNKIGGFECSCVNGYLRDPKNDRRCKAIEGHASLLLSKRNDIRKIALDRKEMTLLVNNTKFAVAIDFMFQTGMLFWSDVQAKKIFKAPIDESNEKMLIISDNITITDGLAIDWIHHFIFWTSSMCHAIKLATLDGSMIKTVVHENILEPRAIALDPIEGWMFWTDWGHNAKIERAALGGTYRSTIVKNEIKWPNGITIDLVSKRIYWIDAKLNIIASCDYNGQLRRTVLFSKITIQHPFSITTFEDYVYWTDWKQDKVYKANKFNGEELEIIISSKHTHHPFVVQVYHPYKQPDGLNICEAVKGHCSHFCLPFPRNMKNDSNQLFNCACPDGFKLSNDKLTCTVEAASMPFLDQESIRSLSTRSLNYSIVISTGLFAIFFFSGIIIRSQSNNETE